MSRLGTTNEGHCSGKTFYVGGAGPVGQVVGTIDVPRGLRRGGYNGAIEVYSWQSVVGGTLRDQVDRGRNRGQAYRLSLRIKHYLDQHPDRAVNVVALSAGTGIATWAVESLPSGYAVQNLVLLGSSLSRDYDLTAALRRIDGCLYAFSSSRDPILKYMVPLTGSVDRAYQRHGAAGLHGFILPPGADEETRRLYRAKLRNRPYKEEWRKWGYRGLHTGATQQEFVRFIITPLILQPPPGQERQGPAHASVGPIASDPEPLTIDRPLP
jgi:pimeloyl-ACP methyl ester carboxylesterase